MIIDFDTQFHMLLHDLEEAIERMDLCVVDEEMTDEMIDQLTILSKAHKKLKEEWVMSREERGNL